MPLLTSSLGLLVLLLYFPGGLVQIGYGARRMLLELDGASGSARRRAKQRQAMPGSGGRASARPSPPGVPALRADGVVVSFGGIVAVDDVSIEVADGEIVGLIGTNGAGKSTLMNAIGGFVPPPGRVELLGDVDHRSVVGGTGPHGARPHASRRRRCSPS